MSNKEVIQAAKDERQQAQPDNYFVKLDDGTTIKISRVSARLISKATEHLEKPIPPEYVNDKTGHRMSNTAHPEYIKALEEYDREYEQISLDAMIMFGIDLVDDLPDNGWEKKLKFLGIEFDENDPFEREFYYKSQIAATPEVLKLISKKTGGLTDEQIESAFDTFQADEVRGRHSERVDSESGSDGDNVSQEDGS